MMISNRIRAARRRLGLTQAELAARLGMTQGGVSQLENLRHGQGITLGRLQRVATALEIPLLELVGEGERAGEG